MRKNMERKRETRKERERKGKREIHNIRKVYLFSPISLYVTHGVATCLKF